MLEQDFYDQLELSVPGREYLALVDSCKSRVLVPEQGFEIHHIHPTSLGGLNVKANKVKFTIFEHCKAHALLAKAIPCYKTLQVVTRMSSGQVKKLSDMEAVTLEKCFEWSVLREKALHHPKPVEVVAKVREKLKGIRRSPEHVARMYRGGMIAVNDGNVCHLIQPEELQEWEARGWKRGRTPATVRRLSKSHLGKSGELSSNKGRVYITNGVVELKVYPKDLDNYTKQGWFLGRSPGFAERHSKAMIGKTNIGKVRINKDGVGKLVTKSELQSYLDNGWVLGIARKSNK